MTRGPVLFAVRLRWLRLPVNRYRASVMLSVSFATARVGRTSPAHPRSWGAPLEETGQVLRLFGYVGAWHEVAGRPTLATYLKGRTGAERTHPCVVLVTGHYVAVSGWLFFVIHLARVSSSMPTTLQVAASGCRRCLSSPVEFGRQPISPQRLRLRSSLKTRPQANWTSFFAKRSRRNRAGNA